MLLAAALALHLTAARPVHVPAAVAQVVDARHALSVVVGGVVKIPFKGVRNFSVADARILDVRVDPTGRWGLVGGRRAGTTTLLLVYDDGSRAVYDVVVS